MTRLRVRVYLRLMKMNSPSFLLPIVPVVVLLFSSAPIASAEDEANAPAALCVLDSASGSKVTGLVSFTKAGDGVKVVAEITGLTPGQHGFHVHEFGDCSAPDATSAGSHFNPDKHQHGAPDTMERHAGDLGNIEADASGKAHLELTDKAMKLAGESSIIGHSVIVHEKADDLKTQPTGDAGGRVACGVIESAK